MPILRLYKLGRSVVVTLPRSILEQIHAFCGDTVEMDVKDGAVWLRLVETPSLPPSRQAATDQHLSRGILRGDE